MLHPLRSSTDFDLAACRLHTLLDVLQVRPVSLDRLSIDWDGFREVFGRLERGEKPVDERDSADGEGLADGPGLNSLIDRSDLPLTVRQSMKRLAPAYKAVVACLRQKQAGKHGVDESPVGEACEKIQVLIGMLEHAAAAARSPSGIAESPLPRQATTTSENRECLVPAVVTDELGPPLADVLPHLEPATRSEDYACPYKALQLLAAAGLRDVYREHGIGDLRRRQLMQDARLRLEDRILDVLEVLASEVQAEAATAKFSSPEHIRILVTMEEVAADAAGWTWDDETQRSMLGLIRRFTDTLRAFKAIRRQVRTLLRPTKQGGAGGRYQAGGGNNKKRKRGNQWLTLEELNDALLIVEDWEAAKRTETVTKEKFCSRRYGNDYRSKLTRLETGLSRRRDLIKDWEKDGGASSKAFIEKIFAKEPDANPEIIKKLAARLEYAVSRKSVRGPNRSSGNN